jgi:hypothetical protein
LFCSLFMRKVLTKTVSPGFGCIIAFLVQIEPD